MTTANLINTCAVCGAEESLDALLLRMIDDDEVRRLIADVLTASFPLGGLVVRYLRLHKPPKQKLRMAMVGKLLAELVPDIQRNVIQRAGRTWPVTADTWKAGVQAVFDAVEKGSLTVPLQGNGYLYQVLMRMADRSEAVQEKQVDIERRGRVHEDGAVQIGAVLPGAAQAAVTQAPFIPPRPLAQAGPKVESPLVRKMKADIARKVGEA